MEPSVLKTSSNTQKKHLKIKFFDPFCKRLQKKLFARDERHLLGSRLSAILRPADVKFYEDVLYEPSQSVAAFAPVSWTKT